MEIYWFVYFNCYHWFRKGYTSPVIITFTKYMFWNEPYYSLVICMYIRCVCRKRMAPHSEDLSEYTWIYVDQSVLWLVHVHLPFMIFLKMMKLWTKPSHLFTCHETQWRLFMLQGTSFGNVQVWTAGFVWRLFVAKQKMLMYDEVFVLDVQGRYKEV